MTVRTLVLNVVNPSAPTALSTLAASLTPGQYSTALGDTGLTTTQVNAIVWVNRFFYDSTRKKALLTAESHGAGTPQWSCYYDEVSNTWTYGSDAAFVTEGNGHVYESQAFDAADNKLYRAQWDGSRLHALSVSSGLDAWAAVTPNWSGGVFCPSTAVSCAWHPNLFGTGDGGVVAIVGAFSTGKWIAWRKATATWHDVPGSSWIPTTAQYGYAGYYSGLTYSPGGDFVIGGTPTSFGTATGGAWFTLGAGSGGTMATATRIIQPPIDCFPNGGGVNLGVVIADPAGSAFPYILEKIGTSRVWKWTGSAWSLRPYTHPFNFVANGNWTVCPVFGKGVFWAKGGESTGNPPSRVWRPND